MRPHASGDPGCNRSGLTPSYWPIIAACLDLITSAPAGSDNNYFLDASADGNEAYVSSAEQLVGLDTDEKYDAYDVRVGGEPQIDPPNATTS